MTDLTNRTVEEVNIFIQKYAEVLNQSELKTLEEAQLFAIMIDVSINHIRDKYNNLPANQKTWCVIAVKRLRNTIKTEEDVKNCIDDYIQYYEKHYNKFVDNLGVFASEFDRDADFMRQYLKTKIGG